MKLLVFGIPRATAPFVLDPSQRTVAVLGRETADNRGQLDIPLPHIDLGGTEPATVRWSREHARFEFSDGRWYITFLGREPTLLAGRQLVPSQKTVLSGDDAALECDGLVLPIKRQRADETMVSTSGRGALAATNETLAGPLRARPIPGGGEGRMQPVRIFPPELDLQGRPGPREPRKDPLPLPPPPAHSPQTTAARLERTRDLVRQIAEDVARARAAAQDAQQYRQTAETARDEVQRGLPEVRSAALVSQVQDAARRASEATARAQTVATKAGTCADNADRALESCGKREQDLRTAVADLRASGAGPGQGGDRSLQSEDQKREAERYLEQVGQHRAEARRASEQAQAAARTVTAHNEQVQKAASERQGEIQRQDRRMVAVKRYGFIVLLFLVATVIGLFIGSLVEPRS